MTNIPTGRPLCFTVVMAALIAIFITTLASAAPVRNTTQNLPPQAEPSFVAEPKGRGTFRLLSSCVFTLVICVWTAIHPNIIRNPTTLRRLIHKAMYVILGLFSPEIVLAIAFDEWLAARKFRKEALQAEGIHEFSWECSFFAVMGGYTISPLAGLPAPRPPPLVHPPLGPSEPGSSPLDHSPPGPSEPGRSESGRSEPDRSVPGTSEPGISKSGTSEPGPSEAGITEPGTSELVSTELGPCEPLLSELGPSESCSSLLAPSKPCIPQEGLSEPARSTPASSKNAEELTLSPNALAFLLGEDIISVPDLAELKDEVTDKEKSDMLAKLLVCIQALWMVVNCLARKVAGLPITLLELNVVMHVICAVIIYGFWWMKPRDAGRPISLSSKFPKSNGTWELVYAIHKYGCILRASSEVPAPPSESSSSKIEKRTATGQFEKVPTAFKDHPYEDQDRGFILITDTNIMLTNRDLEICTTAAQGLRALKQTRLVTDARESEEMKHHLRHCRDDERHSEYCPFGAQVSEAEQRYPLYCSNKEMGSNSTNLIPTRTIPLLFPLCLIYGGIHASAWNSHFPTPIERLMWRVSCAIVAVPGFGPIAVSFFEEWYNKSKSQKDLMKYGFKKIRGLFNHFFRNTLVLFLGILALGIVAGILYGIVIGLKRIPHKLWHKLPPEVIVGLAVVIGAISIIGLVAGWFMARTISAEYYVLISIPLTVIYCAARGYIVVESFICLRSLPYGAFRTISWDDVWPHL